MRTAKTLIRLGGCPGWSESSLGAQAHCWFCHIAVQLYFTKFQICTDIPITLNSLRIDGWSNLSWSVFAGRTLILLVLSCHGSFCIYIDIVKIFRFGLTCIYMWHFWSIYCKVMSFDSRQYLSLVDIMRMRLLWFWQNFAFVLIWWYWLDLYIHVLAGFVLPIHQTLMALECLFPLILRGSWHILPTISTWSTK